MRKRSRKHEIIRTILLFLLLITIIVAGGFISKHRDQFDMLYSEDNSQKVSGINKFNSYKLN